MHLHKGTGCSVKLIGKLKHLKTPIKEPNRNGHILLERHIYGFENTKSEVYSITVPLEELIRVRKFGRIEGLISIEGHFRLDDNTQQVYIFGEKIDFLSCDDQANKHPAAIDETDFGLHYQIKMKNALGYQSKLYFDASSILH